MIHVVHGGGSFTSRGNVDILGKQDFPQRFPVENLVAGLSATKPLTFIYFIPSSSSTWVDIDHVAPLPVSVTITLVGLVISVEAKWHLLHHWNRWKLGACTARKVSNVELKRVAFAVRATESNGMFCLKSLPRSLTGICSTQYTFSIQEGRCRLNKVIGGLFFMTEGPGQILRVIARW